MKGGTYTKTLAKNQVRGIFCIRDIRRNVLPKIIEICVETPCWRVLTWMSTNPGVTLRISWWGCAAGTLEPLTYTRGSSAEFCYPILE